LFVCIDSLLSFFAEPGKDCTTLDNILVLIVGGIPIAMPTVLSVTMYVLLLLC